MTGARVAVVGSLNMDLTVEVESFPRAGETVIARQWYPRAGGKGGNQAIAASRLGATVSMFAAIGEDAYGRELRGVLADNGVNDEFVASVAGPSGVALITVDGAGENTVIVASGANALLTTELVKGLNGVLTVGGALLLQLEVPLATVRWAAQCARDSGATVVLNAAPLVGWPSDDFRDLLAATDVLVVNETEAAMLGAPTPTEDGASFLRSLGPEIVVITLGSQGSVFAEKSGSGAEPGITVQAVDTVGAGDTFCAELVVALLEGKSVRTAVRRANVAGALATTKRGSALSTPSRREVDQRLSVEVEPTSAN